MKLVHRRIRERQAFTLIELMVVIAIVGLLVALVTAAVVKALAYAKKVGNRVDIGELDVALAQFKQRFGFYPPSHLKLCEQFGGYTLTNQLDIDSVTVLTKMFPYISMAIWNAGTPGVGIDWNGNGVIDTTPVILEGDQCLVFFLGGIPAPCPAGNTAGNATPVSGLAPAMLGFAANPKNPADPSSSDRIGPFYDFSSSRLALLPVNPASPVTTLQVSYFTAFRSPLHYSYMDRYGQTDGYGTLLAGAPYAYFSASKGTNQYDPYTGAIFSATGILYSDCPTLSYNNNLALGASTGIWPLAEAPLAGGTIVTPRYPNKDFCQIISAGADQLFGSGSMPVFNPPTAAGTFVGFNLTWTAVSPPQVYNTSGAQPNGADDQSNFSGSPLGSNDQ